jgi:sec-independent protein translocase protein TatB
MLDLGLSKLALIGAVALIVIGPEKLPKVARMAGTLLGRAQRYINNVKAEVNREMQMDELRKMQSDIVSSATNLNKTFTDPLAEAGKEMSEASDAFNETVAEASHAYEGSEQLRLPADWELAAKRRDFRKKKLQQSSRVPVWYKNQNGRKTRVMSGAARVARFRPASNKTVKFFP